VRLLVHVSLKSGVLEHQRSGRVLQTEVPRSVAGGGKRLAALGTMKCVTPANASETATKRKNHCVVGKKISAYFTTLPKASALNNLHKARRVCAAEDRPFGNGDGVDVFARLLDDAESNAGVEAPQVGPNSGTSLGCNGNNVLAVDAFGNAEQRAGPSAGVLGAPFSADVNCRRIEHYFRRARGPLRQDRAKRHANRLVVQYLGSWNKNTMAIVPRRLPLWQACSNLSELRAAMPAIPAAVLSAPALPALRFDGGTFAGLASTIPYEVLRSCKIIYFYELLSAIRNLKLAKLQSTLPANGVVFGEVVQETDDPQFTNTFMSHLDGGPPPRRHQSAGCVFPRVHISLEDVDMVFPLLPARYRSACGPLQRAAMLLRAKHSI
jgi:hypothetical protein